MSYEMPDDVPRYHAEEIKRISKSLDAWQVLQLVFPGFDVQHPAYDAIVQAGLKFACDLRGRIDALFQVGSWTLSAEIWCEAMDRLGYDEVYDAS